MAALGFITLWSGDTRVQLRVAAIEAIQPNEEVNRRSRIYLASGQTWSVNEGPEQVADIIDQVQPLDG